ncbi:hypothetical protein D2E22_0289 [Bifidobacterium castoris]|uniref:Uncharacterized protein n=1 Tax=Bifidobacterium castoris TaxID=2306972 RepID=A0A430FAJ1_9BIFI|nr:hypothetical protein D2E22_0289 [Bifidobacterium castoris]
MLDRHACMTRPACVPSVRLFPVHCIRLRGLFSVLRFACRVFGFPRFGAPFFVFRFSFSVFAVRVFGFWFFGFWVFRFSGFAGRVVGTRRRRGWDACAPRMETENEEPMRRDYRPRVAPAVPAPDRPDAGGVAACRRAAVALLDRCVRRGAGADGCVILSARERAGYMDALAARIRLLDSWLWELELTGGTHRRGVGCRTAGVGRGHGGDDGDGQG